MANKGYWASVIIAALCRKRKAELLILGQYDRDSFVKPYAMALRLFKISSRPPRPMFCPPGYEMSYSGLRGGKTAAAEKWMNSPQGGNGIIIKKGQIVSALLTLLMIFISVLAYGQHTASAQIGATIVVLDSAGNVISSPQVTKRLPAKKEIVYTSEKTYFIKRSKRYFKNI